jgi:hypothetical protein
MIVRFAAASGIGPHSACGVLDGTPSRRFYIRPRNNNITHVYGYGDAANLVSGPLTAGIMAVAGNAAYLNGAADGTMGAWVSTTVSIVIGADSADLSFPYIGDIISLSVYSSTLTPTQVAAITAAMQAL